MDYREKLMIRPGAKVSLADIDPGFHGHHESHEKAMPELGETLSEITRLQELLYAEKKHALLVVLQGIDAAGKDGVCWHVIQAMNPQGTAVTGFKQPSHEELAHDFLWRIHKKVPGLGQVGVFNRSHYEDVLVVRVHKLAPKHVWEMRYDAINAFEKGLTKAGVSIVKFFLYISREEQLERFKRRLDDPARRWKISESDYSERELWDDYVAAYEAMLTKCSTKEAPWYVLPSNHKWFRNLAASKIILEALRAMDMKAPEPSVDIDEIRAKYHKAEKDG
ncbi:polyphosphate kinase 2 family protein [Hoeflea poritis]|uniref:Polyphosphate kinase 2 family protein n=1 Tax=Hoeflea poritis TaxID=2993659 RepID=A0ABT4VN85_9HYPH|nr:polyphosphate kinase 2 family protein [Hoeflea poritis]MDA4846151.1 polyphosphate kinase 2 family protein [Hoeflea poritis]